MTYPRYRRSGRFTPLSIVLGLVGGIVGAYCAAWLYQFLIGLMPWAFVAVIVVLCFGAGIGFGVGMGARLGKCRSLTLGVLLTLIVGVVGVYFSHQMARADYTEHYRETLAADPSLSDEAKAEKVASLEALEMADYLKERAAVGYSYHRRFQDRNIDHGGAYLLWLIEALAILAVAVWVTRIVLSDPYCEASKDWCTETTLGEIYGIDQHALLAAAKRHDLAAMLDPIGLNGSDARLKIKLFTSPSGAGPSYLSGELFYTLGKKKENKELFTNALANESQIATVKERILAGSGTPETSTPSAEPQA